MKEWFKARNIWGAAIQTLSDAEAGRLMKALWNYTMTGEQQNLSGAEKGIFALILMTLCQDEAKDAEISKKRSEAGSLGGNQRVANQANASFASDVQANQANASNKNKELENKESENKNQNKNKSRAKFTPPTVDEVAAYCRERGNSIDPEYFVAYYAKQDWCLANGRKMSDWKMAVITWEKKEKPKGQQKVQPAKTVVAQQYDQRSYDDVSRELMEDQIRDMEEWLARGSA